MGLKFKKVLEKGRAESTELRITRKTVLSEMTFKLRDQYVSKLQDVKTSTPGRRMAERSRFVIECVSCVTIKKGRWFIKKNNSRLLVPTLNKTNENVLTVMGIMFLNNKGVVSRKVNTLINI